MAEDEVQGPSSELDRLGLKQEEAGRQVRTEPCVRWGLQRACFLEEGLFMASFCGLGGQNWLSLPFLPGSLSHSLHQR